MRVMSACCAAWLVVLALVTAAYGQEAPAQPPQAGDEWTEPITGMEFVWVPGGCYEMGCGEWAGDRETGDLPVYNVCVDGFWIGKYEVTQSQWTAIMGNNPSYFQINDNYPVEQVTWEDVQSFVDTISSMNSYEFEFRLPNEAEWEYACRGGGLDEMYAGGNDVDSVAWYTKYEYEDNQSHQVGLKHPNNLGLYDMSGNVMEYVQYWYAGDIFIYHGQENPMYTDNGSSRIMRGGSWMNDAQRVRCVSRSIVIPGYTNTSYQGFRVIRVSDANGE